MHFYGVRIEAGEQKHFITTRVVSICSETPCESKPPARGLRGVPRPKPTSEADLVSDVLCPHKPTPPQDATASPPIRFCLQPLSNPPVHNWPHSQEKPWVERILLHQQVCVLGPLLLGRRVVSPVIR